MKKILILLAITIFISNLSYAQKHKESALEKYSHVKFRIETPGDVVREINEKQYIKHRLTGPRFHQEFIFTNWKPGISLTLRNVF